LPNGDGLIAAFHAHAERAATTSDGICCQFNADLAGAKLFKAFKFNVLRKTQTGIHAIKWQHTKST
jgi:hypothetical protein